MEEWESSDMESDFSASSIVLQQPTDDSEGLIVSRFDYDDPAYVQYVVLKEPSQYQVATHKNIIGMYKNSILHCATE